MAENSVNLHRVLTASPEKLYRAFTDPVAMAAWLPPYGFLCVVHHMEPKVGGSFRMSFINFSTGNGHSFGGQYLELKENEFIQYSDKFDDPNLPGEMVTTVWLKKVTGGFTELKVTQEGIPEVIPADMCYLGWQESLEKLKLPPGFAATVFVSTGWLKGPHDMGGGLDTMLDWDQVRELAEAGVEVVGDQFGEQLEHVDRRRVVHVGRLGVEGAERAEEPAVGQGKVENVAPQQNRYGSVKITARCSRCPKLLIAVKITTKLRMAAIHQLSDRLSHLKRRHDRAIDSAASANT